jgi:hypothetical protein
MAKTNAHDIAKFVAEIMSLGYLINKNTDLTIWVDFAGHVDALGIRIEKDDSRIAVEDIRLDGELYNPLPKLKATVKALENILVTGQVDLSKLHKHSFLKGSYLTPDSLRR